ncbi:MAG: hypothetical protein ACI4K7_10525 [Oscillospiraceae bacterium]
MFYDKKMVDEISKGLTALRNEYENRYDFLKNSIALNGADIIWCGTWAEPYHIDFISDIGDSTALPRKIMKTKKEPKNKAYCSKHFFREKEPVYSVFFGENSEAVCEKFFLRNEKRIIGIKYICGQKKLHEITVEHFDDSGNGVQFDIIQTADNIKSRKYYYEYGAIIRAEAIDGYYPEKSVMWYDDERYKGIGNILPSGCPCMNPAILEEYRFVYNDEGEPSEYMRKSYSYGRVSEHTWKFNAGLKKKYAEYGIRNFNVKR